MKRDILRKALAGEKFTELGIIDCHCHMGPWYNFYFPKADIDEMIKDASIFGIDKLCVAPHASISCDYKLGNKQLNDAICKYPDKILGLLTINGNKPNEITDEFDKYYSDSHYVGIKIHPSLHEYNVAGENYFAAYDIVRQRGGFVLTHSWEGCRYAGMESCEDAIKAFPTVPFILAHAGGVRYGVEKAIRIVNKYENAYMDTSGFEFSDTWIEEIVSRVDHNKIIFGSDMPFHDIRGGICRILLADIDDDKKVDILGGNFRKMLAFNKK